MSEIYGYQGQIYLPLVTPGGTPIHVIPQGTRLAGWVSMIEANAEAPCVWFCKNAKGEAMWLLMRTGGMSCNMIGQLNDGYRFIWSVAGWVDLRNSVRHMRGSASPATFPQRLIGDPDYMMLPDFRVTPDMMPHLLEGWDGEFEVEPY